MSDAEITARNVARVQDIYARYAAGDRGAVFEALAPGVRWSSLGDGALPWAGLHEGPAGVERYFAAVDAEVVVTGYEVEQVVAQGEWIAVLARLTFRSRATGTEHASPKADFLRIVDGRISEFREFYDTGLTHAACVAGRAAAVAQAT
ncbi:nuclear transport factor 2 family protein [Roseomonas sp. CCTCC AB2023176]|uniref:nuclear transport factor 2 family protein n=1 Tax=Roseomonas sp. CCTCC AB2023176 TaxID=3342640 RepID=UPI0035D9B9CC